MYAEVRDVLDPAGEPRPHPIDGALTRRPSTESIRLVAVPRALADPVRSEIVRRPDRTGTDDRGGSRARPA
ncbi:hypothetical protein [Streptomyces sp. NPDC052610]|uniref:hypothetical protein n=1 Tax=Streptomyces sp. NPDC052610 TaxID=3154952 RepID=UPI0034452A35